MQALLNQAHEKVTKDKNVPTEEIEARVAEEYQTCLHRIRDLRATIGKTLEDSTNVLKKVWAATSKKEEIANDPARFPLLRVCRSLRGHFGKVYGVDWTHDSAYLVSASQDGNLMMWNVTTGQKRLAIPLRTGWIMSVAFSPQSNYLASGGLDNMVSVFEITSESIGYLEATPIELQQHEGYISCARFVDEKTLLSASGDANIILWDLEMKLPKLTFPDHSGDVMSVDVRDANTFVSGSCDGTAKLWDIRQRGCVATFRGHRSDVNSVKWFPNGEAFFSGSDDSTVQLWSLRCGRSVAQYHNDKEAANVCDIDCTKSGNVVFASYDEDPYVVAWNVLSGEPIQGLPHPTRAPCIKVGNDGYGVATGGWDKVVRLWA